VLQRLGSELNEPRIHLDAALLWMAEGDTDNAFTLVSRYLEDPLFREPTIYIAYDAGNEQAALNLLQREREGGRSADRADLYILEADLNMLLGDPTEATRLYREVIDLYPQYSWVPYLNLAILTQQRGYLDSAFTYFPEVGSVVMSYARSLVEFKNHERAAEILENYLEEHQDDYQAQLLLLDVQNRAASPAVYQAALWKLYNNHPHSRLLCEHLFLYLLEFNDFSAAEAVLRHYQLATAKMQEPWFLDLRAILSTARRDDEEAVRLLRERLILADSWQARYNLGLLLGKAHQPRQAITQFIEAENQLDTDRRQYYQSRIRSRIGEQYLHLGDEAAARRECEYAVDLDVSNFHAHRILRILEGEQEK
jgi:tetratricopeptide (TPR) repeat protein